MGMDVYEIVTNKIISAIEEAEKNGTKLPWEKEWIRPTYTGKKIKIPADKNSVAYNGTTGRIYSILNQMLCGKAGAWLTFKQIENLGGHIIKGEKASTVVYYEMKKYTDKTEDGEEKEKIIPFLRYYNVFHISQTSGIDESKLKSPTDEIEMLEIENPEIKWSPIETAENIVTDYTTKNNVAVNNVVGDRAFYSPAIDSITVPTKAQFKSAEGYYATLLHEVVHSTGHKSRLNRLTASGFGTPEYAKEELVAEIGSSVLCNMLKIATERTYNNNSAYIQSWLTALKNDKKLIVSASSKAEKAINLILGESQE